MSNKFNKNFYKKTENKLVILLYHGVTAYENSGICNMQGKHIFHEEFREQMDFIKRKCSPLSIDEWTSLRNTKKIPKNPVIVSFDDGFKNNYTTAMPILEELQIPAVFYISSGMIGTDKMFWVDILEDLLNRTTKETIKIRLDEEIKFNLSSNEKIFEALLKIKSFCKSQPNDIKERVIKDLISITNINPSCNENPNYISMSWEELQDLDRKKLFTVGGHSLNHNILSSLNDNELEKEISQSLSILQEKLNHPIFHYSYPEGQEIHYNEKVIKILKQKGIVCSPSAINGVNNQTDDLFHLKRIMVGFDGTEFPYKSEI